MVWQQPSETTIQATEIKVKAFGEVGRMPFTRLHPPSSERSASEASVKLLVVEDEPLIARSLVRLLLKLGYRVMATVNSGEEAIATVTELQPDLVLMDIRLSGEIDGITAATRIRQNLGIPIVYLTACTDEELLERAIATNPSGYVIKPFRQHQLYAVLKMALHQYQTQQDILQELAQAKANSQKSPSFSIASYEVYNSLTAVRRFVSLLKNCYQQWEMATSKQHFQQINELADTEVDVLEALLATSKVATGQRLFEPVPLDVERFCLQLVDAQQLAITAHHTVTFSYINETDSGGTPNTSQVSLDAHLLQHILSQLLSNAIKFSPQGGTINFHVRCQLNAIVFCIQDCGIGIPASEQERVFELFYRANNIGNIPGTGLGLAIVKKSIELHGGDISIESQVGRSTTVTVTIPY